MRREKGARRMRGSSRRPERALVGGTTHSVKGNSGRRTLAERALSEYAGLPDGAEGGGEMKLDLQTVALVAIAAALWVAVFEGFNAF